MSRKRSRPPAAKPGGSSRPGAAPARPAATAQPRGPGPAAALLALVLLAAVVTLALHPWAPSAPPDPIAALPLQIAADSANRRIEDGQFLQAVPYLDRVERLTGTTNPDFESRAAAAAYDATFQVREQNGRVIPITRSSVERVALVNRSLERLDHAEQDAVGLQMRRDVVLARGAQLAVYGFVREAFMEYRRAATLGPIEGRARDEAAWLQQMLADPRPDLPPPPGAASPDSSGRLPSLTNRGLARGYR